MNDLSVLLLASSSDPRSNLVPMRHMGRQCGMRRIQSQVILGSWVLSKLDATHPGWVPHAAHGNQKMGTKQSVS